MDRFTFKKNLLKVIEELRTQLNTPPNEERFIITPIVEHGKKQTSLDDYMRLWLFSEKNLKDRYLDLDAVVDLFSGLAPLFPLWINVMIRNTQSDIVIIELQTSLRFRKPSQTQNQETGHPPFKVVVKM